MSKQPKPGPKDIAFPQREKSHPDGWDSPRDAKTKDVPYDGKPLGRSAR